MKRSISVLLAIVSVAAVVSSEAARPHYGGTLRMQTRAVVRTLDPGAASSGEDRSAQARVSSLVFETLADPNPNGGLRPALARAWETDSRSTTWKIHLRDGVALHSGGSLQTWQVVSALRSANPHWNIAIDADAIVVELDQPNQDFPWELANPRNAIGVRNDAGIVTGTGPFRIDRVDSKRIVLRAHEDYRGGRPFVDAVQIDTGVAGGDLLTNLELGRTDIAALLPTDARRITQRGLRTVESRSLTTYALVFEPPRAGPGDVAVRRTIAEAIDRPALQRVVLQGHGDPAAALLPFWLSGYRIAAATGRASSRASMLALAVEQRTLTLRADPADQLGQAIAERVAVDAREAGLAMTVQAAVRLAPRADVRLVALRLDATTPDRALALAVAAVGPRSVALATNEAAPLPGAPLDAVYRTERALLERFVIVPIVHVPEMYAIADRVEGWTGDPVDATGGWNIANLWLRPEQPQRR